MINKNILSKHFSKNAKNYDEYAYIQKQMAYVLLDLVKETEFVINQRKINILDVGCGTGFMTGLLCEVFPEESITALDIAPGMVDAAKKRLNNKNVKFICDDIETVLIDEKFDLIVSNATFQWLNDLEKTIKKLFDSLSNKGVIYFSTFGEQTFKELRISYQNAKERLEIETDVLPGQNFLRLHELKDMCKRILSKSKAKFSIRERESIQTFDFDTVCDFLNSVKKLGANNSNAERHPKSPSITREMMKIYQRDYCKNGKVQATYHCIFLELRSL